MPFNYPRNLGLRHCAAQGRERRLDGGAVGRQSTAVRVEAIETDFSPKPARETGEPLDFAINGDGFFAVQTAQGVRYTRNGQFSLDPQGRLVTAAGDPVLDAAGRAITAADGKVEPARAKSTRVYVRQNGKWMLVHANFAPVPGPQN